MKKETVSTIAVLIVILALFTSTSLVGFLSLDKKSSSTPAVQPNDVISINNDPPTVDPANVNLTGSRPTSPNNENITPIAPGPNDDTKPPTDPMATIGQDFTYSQDASRDNKAYSVYHQRCNVADYKGDVLDVLSIQGIDTSDVQVIVPFQYGEKPFSDNSMEMRQGSGFSWCGLMDLSSDGHHYVGYSWSPRMSTEWWLPITMVIGQAGTYVVSIIPYDAHTGIQIGAAIEWTITVTNNGNASSTSSNYYTDVRTNLVSTSVYSDTYFELNASATDRYVDLLNNNTKLGGSNGPDSYSLDLGKVRTEWRMDLHGNSVDTNSLRYTYWNWVYGLSWPSQLDGPTNHEATAVANGVSLSLGSFPLSRSYGDGNSLSWMEQHPFDHRDKSNWSSVAPCSIVFFKPGTYTYDLYLTGSEGTMSDVAHGKITVYDRGSYLPSPPYFGSVSSSDLDHGSIDLEREQTSSLSSNAITNGNYGELLNRTLIYSSSDKAYELKDDRVNYQSWAWALEVHGSGITSNDVSAQYRSVTMAWTSTAPHWNGFPTYRWNTAWAQQIDVNTVRIMLSEPTLTNFDGVEGITLDQIKTPSLSINGAGQNVADQFNLTFHRAGSYTVDYFLLNGADQQILSPISHGAISVHERTTVVPSSSSNDHPSIGPTTTPTPAPSPVPSPTPTKPSIPSNSSSSTKKPEPAPTTPSTPSNNSSSTKAPVPVPTEPTKPSVPTSRSNTTGDAPNSSSSNSSRK